MECGVDGLVLRFEAGAEGGIFRRKAPGAHRHVPPDERGKQHGDDGDRQSKALHHTSILPRGRNAAYNWMPSGIPPKPACA